MFNKLMMVCFGIGRGIWVLIMVKFKKSIKFIVGLAIVIVKVCQGVLDFFFKFVRLLNKNRVMDLILMFWVKVIKLWFNLWVIMEVKRSKVVINFKIQGVLLESWGKWVKFWLQFRVINFKIKNQDGLM